MKKVLLICFILFFVLGCNNNCNCENDNLKEIILYCNSYGESVEFHILDGNIIEYIENNKSYKDFETIDKWNDRFNILDNDTTDIVIKKIKSTSYGSWLDFSKCEY